MEQKANKISIVVPVFNSSEVLNELYDRVEKTFAKEGMDFQLILVDDYSADNSWAVISEIKKRNPGKVIGVRMARNFGQHNVIFCGLRYCTGDLIVTMDDDLQNLPEEIPLLIKQQQQTGADIVYGISTNYKKPIARQAASNALKTATRIFSDAYGEGSSFRLMRKELVAKLITHTQRFVFIDEIISWYTRNADFIKVTHEKSKIGRSRYTASKLISLYYNIVIGYDGAPLKTITVIGFISSLFSFLVGLYFIYRKLFFNVRIGYTSIIVSITFSAGLILLSIGVLGEYLRKMYNLLNAQPQFSVSEVLE